MTPNDSPGDERTAGASACAHCGLPARAAKGGGSAFCCVGCRMAAAASGGRGSTGLLEARLVLAAFLAMGVMTFSLVLYGEAVYAPAEDATLRLVREFGRIALAVLSLPVIVLLGGPMLAGAWADLRARQFRMDGLIVLAVAAAWGLSLANTFGGGGEVYFDTATMVLVLVTLGRRLEASARRHGRDAADALAECLPATAHVMDAEGALRDVKPSMLCVGDTVGVLPGEAFPADVAVITGADAFTAAHLTGEEHRTEIAAGGEAPEGAVNGSALVTARVLREAGAGALGRIRALLDAPLPLTRTMRMVDRLAGVLALVSVALALAAGLVIGSSEGAAHGLTAALSVLLVACPCALGLATPLAFRAERAALARRGILVHDPAALEVAATVDHALLDKTGTLTDPARSRVVAASGRETARARMAALVRHSGHALAAALPAAGPAPSRLTVVPGAGVLATIDGADCRAGSPEWMDSTGLTWEPDAAAARALLADDGTTLVAYAEDGRVTALGAVRHDLRPGAREAVRALSELGVTVELCSGDRQSNVAELARELSVTGVGGRSPAQKPERIHELRAAGARVLFAGDGVNDAPALRAADVGVALASGTAAARHQAQVEILGDDLRLLPHLIEGSRRLRAVVRGNLAWTLAYNLVALTLAVQGRLHPLVAAGAMIVSSVVVSTRSYRLLQRPEDRP